MTRYKKYEDAKLISLLKGNDREAFNTIYYRYVPRLFSFLKSLYASDYESEEIVQEIFIKIWEKRYNLDENLSFGAYIFQAAKNKVYNSYRNKLKQLKFHNSFSDQNDKSRNFIDEYIDYTELQEHAQNVVHQLPPVQKKIFLLSRNNGLSNGEIAQKLNLSRRTVEQHIYRALKQLKKTVQVNKVYIPILISCFFNPSIFLI